MKRIIEAIRKEQIHAGEVIVIAIDGRCASGKTTLAKALQTEGLPEKVATEKTFLKKQNVGVIHMDDFFLPRELRTKERLSEAGGNVDYERFAEEAEKTRMTLDANSRKEQEINNAILGRLNDFYFYR